MQERRRIGTKKEGGTTQERSGGQKARDKRATNLRG